MTQLLLFLGFSLLLMGTLTFIGWYKKMDFKTLVGLFLFGIFISIPFILIEFLGAHLKFYLVILAFIGIELAILFFEHHVKYFHDLIHHNIKDLRILSFFLVGIGFTFSEISFTIFHSHAEIVELMSLLPAKTAYALLMHTVLTSAASLIHVGNLFAETLYETVFKFASYYIRIAIISVSHFLYVFSVEQHLTALIIPILGVSTIAFFYFKKHLDSKALA
ncbi:hypothetical protein KKF04_06740 [Patescibacteria group bacterium]|nr:hypothetical protein [Patescibacteria group bacterium]